MRTVHEVSALSGVSIRTLHHYDAIGLLKPTTVTAAGYRLYDETALQRLQSILLFRELRFPLREIAAILDNPAFDPAEALEQQIRLLEMQQRRIGELIALARDLQTKGVDNMNFQAFDREEIDRYAKEVKEKWGGTAAYAEYAERQKQGGSFEESGERLMALFAEIGALRGQAPADRVVQEKIAALQQLITDHYYTCTDEILLGLGQMYVEDERMRQNIDRAGGEGTAAFVQQAVAVYCAGQTE